MKTTRRMQAWLMLVLWTGSFFLCLHRCLGAPCADESAPACCAQAESGAPAPADSHSSGSDGCPFCQGALYAADGLQTPSLAAPAVFSSLLDEHPEFTGAFAADPSRETASGPASRPPDHALPRPEAARGAYARAQSPPQA